MKRMMVVKAKMSMSKGSDMCRMYSQFGLNNSWNMYYYTSVR